MRIDLAGTSLAVVHHGDEIATGRPVAIFLHGAGMNRSVWALQAPLLGGRGHTVLVPDLPGHGSSPGPQLRDVESLADLVWQLADHQCCDRIALIGHSMGALVALAAAGRQPERVARLALLGAAAALPVNDALLAAAASRPAEAIEMIAGWGLGRRAELTGGCAPGVALSGIVRAVLASAKPGVLHADLAACAAWGGGPKAAAAVTCPTLVLAGAEDRMVPTKRTSALASTFRHADLRVVPAAGHMMMLEAPATVADALVAFLGEELPD